jgi:hypothetical protein
VYADIYDELIVGVEGYVQRFGDRFGRRGDQAVHGHAAQGRGGDVLFRSPETTEA